MADTGKTGTSGNMKDYGVKIGTGDFGDIAIYFRGKENIYDSLLTELGLIDMSASPEPVMMQATLAKGRLDFFSTIHVTLVETSAGGDGAINTSKLKIRCAPDKAGAAAKGLKGKTINGKTVLRATIC